MRIKKKWLVGVSLCIAVAEGPPERHPGMGQADIGECSPCCIVPVVMNWEAQDVLLPRTSLKEYTVMLYLVSQARDERVQAGAVSLHSTTLNPPTALVSYSSAPRTGDQTISTLSLDTSTGLMSLGQQGARSKDREGTEVNTEQGCRRGMRTPALCTDSVAAPLNYCNTLLWVCPALNLA